MKATELTPTDGRKSFYGKCKMVKQGSQIDLFSYSTKAATYVNGLLFIYNCESVTTARHLKAFIAYLGLPSMTTKELKTNVKLVQTKK